jgi:hypothetical protein
MIERCVVMLRARTEALAAPSSSFVERDDPDVTVAVCWIVALGVRYRQLSASQAERISRAVLAGRPARVSRVATAAGQQHDHQGTALLSRVRGERPTASGLAG